MAISDQEPGKLWNRCLGNVVGWLGESRYPLKVCDHKIEVRLDSRVWILLNQVQLPRWRHGVNGALKETGDYREMREGTGLRSVCNVRPQNPTQVWRKARTWRTWGTGEVRQSVDWGCLCGCRPMVIEKNWKDKKDGLCSGLNSIPPESLSTQILGTWPSLEIGSLQMQLVKLRWGHSELGWSLNSMTGVL